MRRPFYQIVCEEVETFEQHKFYYDHMTKVAKSKAVVDTTRPQLPPRHRMIAEKAEMKRREFLKANQSPVRSTTRSSRISNAGGQTRTTEIDPYSSPMFPIAAPVTPPERLNFLDSYHNNQTRPLSRASALRKRTTFPTNAGTSRSFEDPVPLLDINFESEPSSSSEDDLTHK
jgi:hypothetical protein